MGVARMGWVGTTDGRGWYGLGGGYRWAWLVWAGWGLQMGVAGMGWVGATDVTRSRNM